MAQGLNVFSFLLLFLGLSSFTLFFCEFVHVERPNNEAAPKPVLAYAVEDEKHLQRVNVVNPCHSEEEYRTILNTPVLFEGDQPRFQKFGKQGVYSAFYDAREPPKRVVRIIGIVAKNLKVYCHMIASSPTGENQMQVVPAVREPFDRATKIPTRPYSSIVVCPINDDFPVPQRVVLAEAECGHPVASLQVLNQNTRDIKYNFTVCLHKPLFGVGLKDVPSLLEWIAVNRVFGGEHFVIYTLPSTDEIRKYLQPLVASGLLEIHLFDMVLPANETTENHNQKAVINECVYRHMYTSKRLVMIDFDEFPTPHSKDNWQDLINTSPCAKESAVYFKNRFFPMQLTGKNVSHSDILVTALEKNLQTKESFQCPVRSKVIINPRHVHMCTVHSVHTYISGVTRTGTCCMPEDLGHLHHYREWGKFTQKKTTEADGLVTDHRMWHFESKIIGSVRDVYKIQNMTPPKAA
ncbi:hypothetical protein CAPTEDRAFT_222031 [Capitella teleta]|uniref:Glycosyltransferase family 92 protein n=1 Tax=Capitella teleta TaxID=283909 RepID=R7UGD1_CAPTE|nr:hypothetical protein CAPTEDRAFT_222031 [Capitella teleta]|eukprot:ELU02347.1 hypothetical protein CAPTEDRAFT_222031 [Capitella teleta]